LCAHHHVDTGISQWNGLYGALMRFDLSGWAFDSLARQLDRLKHDHPCAGLQQARGEFASSGTHFEYRLARLQARGVSQPGADLGRVIRAPAYISVSALGIALSRSMMKVESLIVWLRLEWLPNHSPIVPAAT
jgi:hypothetical protein